MCQVRILQQIYSSGVGCWQWGRPCIHRGSSTVYEDSILSVQFYYESKIALKTKLHLKKKKEWNASSTTTWINVKDIMLS